MDVIDLGDLTTGAALAELGRDDVDELRALVSELRRLTGSQMASIVVLHRGRFHHALCDGTQEFTSAHDDAICQFAAEDPGTFTIEDLSTDGRTMFLPWVDGRRGRWRFYASTPLRTSQGGQLGRLCLWDEQARTLESHQAVALGRLSEQVEAAMQQRLRHRHAEAVRHVDVGDLVAELVDDVGDLLEVTRGRIEIGPELDPVPADPDLLLGALRELVLNALTHLRSSTPPVVRIRAVAADDVVRLEVGDRGPGLPPAVAAGLAAGRIEAPEAAQGLRTALHVARLHDGRLGADPAPGGHGTTMWLELPVPR